MKRWSIRAKLTLWYGAALAVALTVFSIAVYLVMRHQLQERIDEGLEEELADVLYEVKRAQDVHVLHDWLERRFGRHEGFDFQVTRPDGERFFFNARLADRSLPLPDPVRDLSSPVFDTESRKDSGQWRVVSVKVPGPDGPFTVQVARSLDAFEEERAALLLPFLVTGPLALLIATGGGYFLARWALAPVQRMTESANEITAERLGRRIEVPNPDDELGRLAWTLNRMIERLERSFAEMQRFTADAAHELRTPLAVMRSEAEIALRAPRSHGEYCRVLENLLDETNRLAKLADQLLFLCRQDAGLAPVQREQIDLSDLLNEVVGNMELVAQEKGVSLLTEANEPCQLSSDGRLLRRLLYNLLDNAIKYTGPSGRVTVNSHRNGASFVVAIKDTGVGIPPEHLPHVFDRFYRVDPARTGETSGSGLGLAICHSMVKSLGGFISLDSIVGRGTTATLTFDFGGTSECRMGT